jgi:C-terminal processing protease CtpA/Prc
MKMLRNAWEHLIQCKRFVFRVCVFVCMFICLQWRFLPASTASGARGDGTGLVQLNQLNKSKGELGIGAKAVVLLDLYKKAWTVIKYCFYDQRFNGQEWSRWEHHYDGKLRTIDDAHLAIATMLASLNDPYTRSLDQSSFDQAVSRFNHGISGVGMQLGMNKAHQVIVVAVIDGSPALAAGVKSGDQLTEVDDKPIAGQSLDAVVQQIRGKAGTKVTITVRRDEDPRELLPWARLTPNDHDIRGQGIKPDLVVPLSDSRTVQPVVNVLRSWYKESVVSLGLPPCGIAMPFERRRRQAEQTKNFRG